MFKVRVRASKIKLRLKNGLINLTNEFEHHSSTGNLVDFKQMSSPIAKKQCDSEKYIKEDDVLFADKAKLRQILRNLMSIAIKFTPENGNITLTIKFLPNNKPSSKWLDINTFQKSWNVTSLNHTEEASNIVQDDMLVIEVQDTGAGISPENQQRLFKEIVQFNPEKLQAGGGSGLGLFISKSVVDMRGFLTFSTPSFSARCLRLLSVLPRQFVTRRRSSSMATMTSMG